MVSRVSSLLFFCFSKFLYVKCSLRYQNQALIHYLLLNSLNHRHPLKSVLVPLLLLVNPPQPVLSSSLLSATTEIEAQLHLSHLRVHYLDQVLRVSSVILMMMELKMRGLRRRVMERKKGKERICSMRIWESEFNSFPHPGRSD